MKARWPCWGVAVLLVALVASEGVAQGKGAEERPEVGFRATDFALPDLSGKLVRLSDFLGKKAVFLNFWAVWCPYCQEEMPTMEQLHRQFKDRGLEIVAVSIDKDRADVAKFVKEHGLTFPVLLDPDFKVAGKYRVAFVPTHYFIDRTGVIKSREIRSKDWSKPETWRAIEELLRP